MCSSILTHNHPPPSTTLGDQINARNCCGLLEQVPNMEAKSQLLGLKEPFEYGYFIIKIRIYIILYKNIHGSCAELSWVEQ